MSETIDNPFADLMKPPAAPAAAQGDNPFADLMKPPAAAPQGDNPFADLAPAPQAPTAAQPQAPPADATMITPGGLRRTPGAPDQPGMLRPLLDQVTSWNWLGRPEARPSAITNAPVGSTITMPAMPDVFTPPEARPSAITNKPVGATIPAPRLLEPYASAQVQSGVQDIKMIPPALGVMQGQRLLGVLDRLDRGEAVPLSDDPRGYSALSPEQRAAERVNVMQRLGGSVSSLVQTHEAQQALPVDPAVKAFQDAKGWQQTAQALINAPGAVLQDTLLRQLPGLAAMTGASIAGGPAAGFIAGLAAMGPPQFGQELVAAMRQQGVDINNGAQRTAWVAGNPEVIKQLWDRSLVNAGVTTALQVGPFHGAQYLPFRGAVPRMATGAGLGAITGGAAPYVGQVLGGPPATPQAVLQGAIPGAAMGLAGGVGSRAVPREPPVNIDLSNIPRRGTDEAPPSLPPEAVPPLSSTPAAREQPIRPVPASTAGDGAGGPARGAAGPDTAATEGPLPASTPVVSPPVEPRPVNVPEPRPAPAPPAEPPRPVEPEAQPVAGVLPQRSGGEQTGEPSPPGQPRVSSEQNAGLMSRPPAEPPPGTEAPKVQPVSAEPPETRPAAPAPTAPEPAPTPETKPVEPAQPAPGGGTAATEPPAGEAPPRQSSPEPPSTPAVVRTGETGAKPPEAPTPPQTESGKRPVTSGELDALNKRVADTRKAVARAERKPGTAEAELARLRQAAEDAQAARDAAEGPPPKPAYQPGRAPPDADEQHATATAAHEDLVARRVHAEGGEAKPEPAKAGRALSIAPSLVEGTDTSGARWAGSGHVMVRGDVLDRELKAAAKKPRQTPDPQAIDRVTQEQKGVTYGTLTPERQVTPPGLRESVIYKLPNGQRVVLDKGVSDALHKAAGKDGTLVHDVRGPEVKASDTRVLAKNAKGEIVGVGMPRRHAQREAGIYATGEVPPREAPTAKPTRQPRPRKTQETIGDITETPGEAARRQAAQVGLAPEFNAEARTERASRFNQAFSEAGHDPAQAVNYHPAKQIEILSKHLMDKFGFKSVLGSPRDRARAIDNMLDANRNLQVLAHVLGIRPHDISLGGRLSLNMVPVNGRFFGSYDPRSRSINMAGRSNSFAHEWIHALDHFLVQHLRAGRDVQDMASRQVMGAGFREAANLNTDTARAFSRVLNSVFTGNETLARQVLDLHMQMDRYGDHPGQRIPPELIAARDQMLQTLLANPSEYFQRAVRYGNATGQGGYFAHPWEMLARAGEAYVGDAVQRLGDPTKTTEFISKSDRGYLSDGDARFRNTFPKQDERALIFDSYRELFDALRRDQILGDGTPGSAKPTTLPGNFDIIDPRRWDTGGVRPEDRGVAAALRRVAGGVTEDARLLGRAIIEPGQTGSDAVRRFGVTTREGETMAGMAGRTARNAANAVSASLGGRVGVLAARYKDNLRAQASIQRLRDLIDPQAGMGRLIRPTYGRAVNREFRARTGRIANILDHYGLTNMSQTQKDMLMGQLTGQGTPGTPRLIASQPIVEAAAAIRHELRELWYYAQRKGVDVPFAKESYFPRSIVSDLVFNDPQGFVRAATETYRDQFTEQLAGKTGPEREAAINDLLAEKGIKRQGRDEAGARDIYAETAANNWHNRLREGRPESFDTLGPDSGFTNARKLPASADRHLREFYVRDPVDALSQHIMQAVSRAEYVDRFGRTTSPDATHGTKLEEMSHDMNVAGVHPHDIDELQRIVELVTGRNRVKTTRSLQNMLDTVYALGTVGLMPRAMYASLAEPAMAAIRTRNLNATMAGFRALLGNVLKGDNAIRLQDLARMHGIVTHSMFENIMTNRTTSGMHEGSRLHQFMTDFYRRFGLTGLTDYQRTAMVAPAEVFLRQMLDASQTGTGRAKAEAMAQLREMGIADHEQQGIHEFMNLPENRDYLYAKNTAGPEGRKVGNALATLVDEIIQDPTRIDKPELSQHPSGRFLYGLMGFNFAIARNLHGRMWNEAVRQNSFGAGLRTAAGFIPAIAALYALNVGGSMIRDAAFGVVNKNTDPEVEAERSMVWRPLSRSGLFGPADSLVQAYTGWKYQRSISSLFAGAQLGFFGSALENILKPLAGENSPNTNTAERNQVKGAHAIMSVPLIAAMTALPGGWPTALAGQWLSSPAGANFVANLIAGEQQTRGGGHGRPQRPERPERPSRPSR